MGMIKKLVAAFRRKEAAIDTPEQSPPEPVSPDLAPEPAGNIKELLPAPAPEKPVPGATRQPKHSQETEPRSVGVKRVVLAEAGLSVLDLRELPSNRFRIVGSSYWVTDTGRHKHGSNEYLLVREPRNQWDVNAVAVYGKGRKVGYLTTAKAAALAPIFDGLPYDAFRVGGAPPSGNSITMWVDIPALPKLRKFAGTVTASQAGTDDQLVGTTSGSPARISPHPLRRWTGSQAGPTEEGLRAWAERVAAGAPPLRPEQRKVIISAFSSALMNTPKPAAGPNPGESPMK